MDRGASEHDDVLLARPKRYVCRLLGAIAACSVGMGIANANVAAVIRDTLYIDGGYLWWEPGTFGILI